MSSAFECPYCASCRNKLISSFYSAVLEAKTTVYQCEECLNLFNLPRDVKKQELQEQLNQSREDAEEQISVITASELSLDPGDESQVLVVVYSYDCLMNRVPVDSFWATPSVQSSSLEPETATNLDNVDSSTSYLLKLFFALLQIIFGLWLLYLAFGF